MVQSITKKYTNTLDVPAMILVMVLEQPQIIKTQAIIK